MSAKPNNGLVVGRYRLLVLDEHGDPSVIQEVASAVFAVASAFLGSGDDLDTRSYRLRVSDYATGAVVAERRFRRRRSAVAARESAIARYTAAQAGSLQPDWQTLLDAAP